MCVGGRLLDDSIAHGSWVGDGEGVPGDGGFGGELHHCGWVEIGSQIPNLFPFLVDLSLPFVDRPPAPEPVVEDQQEGGDEVQGRGKHRQGAPLFQEHEVVRILGLTLGSETTKREGGGPV
jgi:hypothetical protein